MHAGVPQWQKRLFARKSSSTVKTLMCGQTQHKQQKGLYVRKSRAKSKNGFMCAKVRQIAKKACVRAEVTQEQKRLYPRKSSTKQQNAYICAQKQHKQQKSLYAHIQLLKMNALICYLARVPTKNQTVFSHYFFLNTFF